MTDINQDFAVFKDKISNVEDLDKQKVLYKRMTRLSTKTDDLYYPCWKLALLLFQEGKYKEAEQKLNKAIQISPNEEPIFQDWLATLYFGRKLKDAVAFGNKYFYKFGKTYPLQNNIGMCYLHIEDYFTATECFRMAIFKDESFRLAYMNLALALYLQRKQFEARKTLDLCNTITAYEIGVYNQEICNLKEHLEREDDKEVQEKMKAKIEGFEFILHEMEEKQKILNGDGLVQNY